MSCETDVGSSITELHDFVDELAVEFVERWVDLLSDYRYVCVDLVWCGRWYCCS